MSTRIIGVSLLALGLFAAPALAQPANPRRTGVNAREHRQATRIKDGVKDKALTKPELDKLRADEAGVRAEERAFRRSGDGLNSRERKDLQHDLDKTSREIYRDKHNNRTR